MTSLFLNDRVHAPVRRVSRSKSLDKGMTAFLTRSLSVSGASRRKKDLIALHQQEDELNIFGSSMVTKEFVLDKINQVKHNKAIVKLEIEDLLSSDHHMLLPLVKALLAGGGRRWKWIRFLDAIDAEELLWWQGMKSMIHQEYARTVCVLPGEGEENTSNGMTVPLSKLTSFEANVRVEQGTTLQSVLELLKTIKEDNKENLQHLSFSGSSFWNTSGKETDTVPKTLSGLFRKVNNKMSLRETFSVRIIRTGDSTKGRVVHADILLNRCVQTLSTMLSSHPSNNRGSLKDTASNSTQRRISSQPKTTKSFSILESTLKEAEQILLEDDSLRVMSPDKASTVPPSKSADNGGHSSVARKQAPHSGGGNSSSPETKKATRSSTRILPRRSKSFSTSRLHAAYATATAAAVPSASHSTRRSWVSTNTNKTPPKRTLSDSSTQKAEKNNIMEITADLDHLSTKNAAKNIMEITAELGNIHGDQPHSENANCSSSRKGRRSLMLPQRSSTQNNSIRRSRTLAETPKSGRDLKKSASCYCFSTSNLNDDLTSADQEKGDANDCHHHQAHSARKRSSSCSDTGSAADSTTGPDYDWEAYRHGTITRTSYAAEVA